MQKEVKGKNRRTSRRKNRTIGIFLVVLLAALAVLLLSYKILGTKLTIVVALLMFVFLGFCFLICGIKNKKRRRKIISIIIIFCLIIGIICLSAFCAFMIYVKKEADPKYENAKLYKQEVTRMYDKDGNEFAKLGEENREKIKYDQLPEVLVDAIISIEDSRFFSHNGFDAPRFLKASLGQLTMGEGAGGASTLTMQVVKNSFTSTEASGIKGITRKFEDIYLAVFKLEKDYSKQEIIEYYVNNHHLGGNTYGVQEASRKYFGKDVTDLNLSEAAIIAGMFKAPNGYQPINHPEAAAKRRKTVLYQMRNHGYISKEEEQIANDIPIEVLTANATPTTENEFQGYVDTVANELKDKYGVNPYTTPLLVYTNLDRNRQKGVNAVLNGETYNWKDDKVQSGVAVLDSETGKILAIGNGRNIDNRSNAQLGILNYATGIKRQPGSTAKPVFDYGPGMEYNNWSTYQLFKDEPYTYSNGRSIKNWDGGHFGTITLRTALAHSRNIPALKAFQQVDNDKIRDFVANLGIKPEVCSKNYTYNNEIKKCVNDKDANDTQEPAKLHEAHSIGAFTGVSPLVMAGAYAAFSNGGYYNEPYTVEKFTYRKTGETIEHQSNKKQVMSDSTAFMIASILQDVALNGGTPKNVAAKTGTTNYDDKTMADYEMPWDAIRDSWVVGFSRKTVIGMWYGYDWLTKEQIAEGYILHNIPATIAKDQLFNALVAAAMESNREEFVAPSSVVRVAVAPGSDPPKLAAPGTEGVYEYFKKGFEPTEYDTTNYKLDGPKNFKVKENKTKDKVTLSWSAVDPGILANPARGKWGYNIYKDGILIDWTDKTSYTYSPKSDIYGEYKVKATYKNYSGAQSSESVFNLERTVEPDPVEPEPTTTCPIDATLNKTTGRCECIDKTKTYDVLTNKCV